MEYGILREEVLQLSSNLIFVSCFLPTQSESLCKLLMLVLYNVQLEEMTRVHICSLIEIQVVQFPYFSLNFCQFFQEGRWNDLKKTFLLFNPQHSIFIGNLRIHFKSCNHFETLCRIINIFTVVAYKRACMMKFYNLKTMNPSNFFGYNF